MNRQPMHAKLIRVDAPKDFWDLRQASSYVFLADDGIEEQISADYVPIDCREIGVEVELVYTYFSIGNAEGYHLEPRALTEVEHKDEIPF